MRTRRELDELDDPALPNATRVAYQVDVLGDRPLDSAPTLLEQMRQPPMSTGAVMVLGDSPHAARNEAWLAEWEAEFDAPANVNTQPTVEPARVVAVPATHAAPFDLREGTIGPAPATRFWPDAPATAADVAEACRLIEGALMEHAQRELGRAGLMDADSDYGGMLGKSVLTLVRAMEGQGHSGMSAQMAVDLFERLARYEPLTPLTDDPAEWMDRSDISFTREQIAEGKGIWQSIRHPGAFSEDGGKTYTLLEETVGPSADGGDLIYHARTPPIHTSAPHRLVEKASRNVECPGCGVEHPAGTPCEGCGVKEAQRAAAGLVSLAARTALVESFSDDVAARAARAVRRWQEEEHPRGKTTPASNSGSFAPKVGDRVESNETGTLGFVGTVAGVTPGPAGSGPAYVHVEWDPRHPGHSSGFSTKLDTQLRPASEASLAAAAALLGSEDRGAEIRGAILSSSSPAEALAKMGGREAIFDMLAQKAATRPASAQDLTQGPNLAGAGGAEILPGVRGAGGAPIGGTQHRTLNEIEDEMYPRDGSRPTAERDAELRAERDAYTARVVAPSILAAVQAHALAHYAEGWDPVVEAYEPWELAEAIAGSRTAAEAIARLAQTLDLRAEVAHDVRAAGDIVEPAPSPVPTAAPEPDDFFAGTREERAASIAQAPTREIKGLIRDIGAAMAKPRSGLGLPLDQLVELLDDLHEEVEARKTGTSARPPHMRGAAVGIDNPRTKATELARSVQRFLDAIPDDSPLTPDAIAALAPTLDHLSRLVARHGKGEGKRLAGRIQARLAATPDDSPMSGDHAADFGADAEKLTAIVLQAAKPAGAPSRPRHRVTPKPRESAPTPNEAWKAARDAAASRLRARDRQHGPDRRLSTQDKIDALVVGGLANTPADARALLATAGEIREAAVATAASPNATRERPEDDPGFNWRRDGGRRGVILKDGTPRVVEPEEFDRLKRMGALDENRTPQLRGDIDEPELEYIDGYFDQEAQKYEPPHVYSAGEKFPVGSRVTGLVGGQAGGRRVVGTLSVEHNGVITVAGRKVKRVAAAGEHLAPQDPTTGGAKAGGDAEPAGKAADEPAGEPAESGRDTGSEGVTESWVAFLEAWGGAPILEARPSRSDDHPDFNWRRDGNGRRGVVLKDGRKVVVDGPTYDRLRREGRIHPDTPRLTGDMDTGASASTAGQPERGSDGRVAAHTRRSASGKVTRVRDFTRAVQRRVGATQDGVNGPKTQAAVRAYQRKHGLVVDGIVGKQTASAMLGNRSASKVAPGVVKADQVHRLAAGKPRARVGAKRTVRV